MACPFYVNIDQSEKDAMTIYHRRRQHRRPEVNLKHTTESLALSGPTVEYRCTTAQGMYKYRRGSLKIVKRNIIPFARKGTTLEN